MTPIADLLAAPLSGPPAAGTIHLTRARLDAPPVPLARLEALLAPEELARADRFRFDHLRRRHVVSWGLLRLVLADITGDAPETLRFTRNAHGKPRLDPGPDHASSQALDRPPSFRGPSFNLAHSDEHLLIGVAREGRLGVDLEAHRDLSDLEKLARRFFASEESDSLLSLPSTDRVRAFFRIWARKEAFVKAVGGGLSVPLRSFAVRLTPEEGNCLVRLDPELLAPFDPAPGGMPAGGVQPPEDAQPSKGAPPPEGRPAPQASRDPVDWWVASVRPPAEGIRSAPDGRDSAAKETPPLAMAVAWDRGPARIRWHAPPASADPSADPSQLHKED